MYLFGENGSVRSSLEKRCARLPMLRHAFIRFFCFYRRSTATVTKNDS
jgi:hypothetical protein